MFKSKIQNRSSITPLVSSCVLRKTFNDTSCVTVRRRSNIILNICALAFVILASGCASTNEICKGALGISTKVLEDSRKDAIKKEFNFDLITCHNKVRSILKDTGSFIYADDLTKDMIAVYISEEDTTPVGLFLTDLGHGTTLIEVTSPSIYGKEKISKTVFDALTTGKIKKLQKGKPDELKNKNKY